MTNRIPGDERWRRELSELLTRIGTMILCRVSPLHEPPPHPFPLPIRWGEGGRRSGEGRFMVPMHAEKRKGAFHEPTHPWPLPGGELGKRAPTLTPLLRRGWGWVHGPNSRPNFGGVRSP